MLVRGRFAPSNDGSACGAIQSPTRRIVGRPKAMSCCPHGMNATRSAPRGRSTGTDSAAPATKSTRSATHWPQGGIRSTSTAIDSSFVAMNVRANAVDCMLNRDHACRNPRGMNRPGWHRTSSSWGQRSTRSRCASHTEVLTRSIKPSLMIMPVERFPERSGSMQSIRLVTL